MGRKITQEEQYRDTATKNKIRHISNQQWPGKQMHWPVFFFFVVIKVIATVSMLQAYKKARAVASVIMEQQHKMDTL
jgi:hypothetical protein